MLQALLIAAPFFLLWLSARKLPIGSASRDRQKPSDLTAAQVQQLRTLARRTWLFFEHFVGPDDNWLPPDHFQESPRGVRRPPHLAHQYRALSADACWPPMISATWG